MNDFGFLALYMANVDDLLPCQQFPPMEPSLKKSNWFVSVPFRPMLLSTKRLFWFRASVCGSVPSENAEPPHMKLPKMSLSFTSQPLEPNRTTPMPVG